MTMNIDEHLDEVLGIIQKPKREIKKVEKVKPAINGLDDNTDSFWEALLVASFHYSSGIS